MNEYGNGELWVGFSSGEEGVSLWVQHPVVANQHLRVFTVEPEFAREIAMNMTLESEKVDEIRRRKSSGR